MPTKLCITCTNELARTDTEVITWPKEAIHVKEIFLWEPGSIMRVKLDKIPVISHIKARSKVLITSGTYVWSFWEHS